jgi:hypothetical protein
MRIERFKVVFDEFEPIAVATDGDRVYNGMPVVAGEQNLVLLLSDGSRVASPGANKR